MNGRWLVAVTQIGSEGKVGEKKEEEREGHPKSFEVGRRGLR